MIKSLLLVFISLVTLLAQAQPSADLRVEFIQPENEQNLEATEIYLAMLEVENHGPDSVRSCDTLWLRVTFSGIPTPNPIYITGLTIAPDHSIPLSQQIAFDQSWIGSSCTICMRIDPLNAETGLYDPDTTNNEDCIHVQIVEDVTGIDENADRMVLFPVPATDYFQLESDEPVERLYAVDFRGIRSELLLNNGFVNCSELTNGIYLLQAETASGIVQKRLVIAR